VVDQSSRLSHSLPPSDPLNKFQLLSKEKKRREKPERLLACLSTGLEVK